MLKSIDILIGISVVMLVVSMAVTLLTHLVTTLSNSRGRHLMRGLADILQQIDPALTEKIATKISRAVLTHPLVSDVSNRLGTVIHREEFTKILMDLATKNSLQKLEKDARDALLKVMQDHGIQDPQKALKDIRARALSLEQSNPELANDVRMNLAIMQEAPRNEFVPKIHAWFDQTIDRVSSRFTASTRVITCLVALIVAFAIQLDSIGLINRLAADPELRKTLLAQAHELAKNPPATVTPPQQGPGGNAPAASQSQQQSDNAKVIEDNLKLTDEALASRGLLSWPQWTWKPFCGILLYPALKDYSLHMLLGILLTAALLSLGAPFWYDTLKTALRLRSAVASKDDDQREVRQTTQQADQQQAPSQPSTAPLAAGALAGERGDLGAVG